MTFDLSVFLTDFAMAALLVITPLMAAVSFVPMVNVFLILACAILWFATRFLFRK